MESEKCLRCDPYAGPHGIRYRAVPRPRKSIEYRSKIDDCPEDCRELIRALIDPKRRRKWQTAITRIFREARNYDQQWADDPKNPFPVGWLKNGLPLGLRPEYENSPRIEKLSKQDDQVFRQLAKEHYSCRLLRGKKYQTFLENFDKKYAEYENGHRYFYIFTAGISHLTNDRDLLCTVLGFCHDEISDVAEKIISDEIKKIYPDAYIPLRNFTYMLPTFQFKILVMYARVKGLLTKTNSQDKTSPQKNEMIQAGRDDDENHNYCKISISKKEFGLSMGFPEDRKIAEQVNRLCKLEGIVLQRVNRQEFRVAVDTLKPSYKLRFQEYMKKSYKLSII